MTAAAGGDAAGRQSAPPTVSVVLTCFNYARYLPESLNSVLTQAGVQIELIAVDDASTDGSARVIQGFADADQRVRLISHPVNRGQVAAANSGIAAARGDFVVKLDADDLLAPGALSRAAKLMIAQPSVGLAYGPVTHFTSTPPMTPQPAKVSWRLWPGWEWLDLRFERAVNVISSPEVMIRTAALHEAGPFKEDLPHTHDLFMWLAIAAKWDIGRLRGPVQGYYRVHSESLSRTGNAGRLKDFEGRRDAFDLIFSEYGASLAGRCAGTRDSVRGQLARQALDRVCRHYDRGQVTPDDDDLVKFALETYDHAKLLPQWRALRRRRIIGPDKAKYVPIFFARAILRRAQDELSDRQWRREGV